MKTAWAFTCRRILSWNLPQTSNTSPRETDCHPSFNLMILLVQQNIWSLLSSYKWLGTCVSAFVEILQSLQCKIFQYTFLGQYPMKSWDFFFLCKIQQPAWLQLSHRKLGPPGMRLFRLLYPKTEKPSFKCDILLWKTLIRVSIEF